MTCTVSDLPAMGLLSPNSLVFAKYWGSLPKVGLLPDRQLFAPEDVRSILRNFVILEIVSPEEVRFRLAGTAEADRYGRDVTGLNYMDFVDPARRPKAHGAFQAMAATPCGMVATIQSKSSAGLDFINEAIGFPFSQGDGQTPLLYFQSNTLTDYSFHDAYEDRLAEHTRVTRRFFIDIGAGIPDFSD
ncbi:MAG TPA: PAS domain-containing protein [Dongiaceae bacterium]|nr:PAS domain-containing protein [Dongiaceae bacterium]